MHPLTILAVGLYGEVDAETGWGADPPHRALEIRVQERQVDRPDSIRRAGSRSTRGRNRRPTSMASTSNVNPDRDHPRWSQATERRIGEFFMRKTVDVQRLWRPGRRSLCTGMDLKEILLSDIRPSRPGRAEACRVRRGSCPRRVARVGDCDGQSEL